MTECTIYILLISFVFVIAHYLLIRYKPIQVGSHVAFDKKTGVVTKLTTINPSDGCSKGTYVQVMWKESVCDSTQPNVVSVYKGDVRLNLKWFDASQLRSVVIEKDDGTFVLTLVAGATLGGTFSPMGSLLGALIAVFLVNFLEKII